MITRLSISNLAIIEKAEVDFAPGLNVLTGETGSGKSVIMGAIGLALGARSDASSVRDGEENSRIEAEFEVGEKRDLVNSVLSDAGLPNCEDGELIIRRVLSGSGAGKVWVNDSRTTLTTLKNLARVLVDIHGARANQSLLEESFQRHTLDKSAKIDLEEYSKAWRELAAKRSEIDSLLSSTASEDELDLLRYQVGELEAARLTIEDDEIEERHAAAAHAEEIVEIASSIADVLGGDNGVAERLISLQPKFNRLKKYFKESDDWANEAEDATIKIQELSRAIADAMTKIDADPAELEELDARLSIINRLKRKYLKNGENTVEALLAVLSAKRERLDSIEGFDVKLAQLRKAESAALETVKKVGAKLSKERSMAGEKLSRLVTRQLRDLGFLKAKFYVDFEKTEPTSGGCEKVCYMFEPNLGESAKPLAEIASSGEIARVMLALKSVLALNDGADTVIFDEIDANVGGEVARQVGEKMRLIGSKRQVIAITHLPQSAVFASRHLVVSKSVVGGRTLTAIKEVVDKERVKEIARMLGGEASMPIVGEHAKELLASAAKK
ncbi:MAG: DNA repair protein RecN [Kiritimatiellae bacterium]|nr:DNA repair protein RecN [Kiritimatiellia bacterium]